MRMKGVNYSEKYVSTIIFISIIVISVLMGVRQYKMMRA